MARKAFIFLARLAAACTFAIAVSGVAHVVMNPGSDASGSAGEAVADLARGKHLGDKVPPGFAKAMGYQPTFEGRPDGSCSTPGGLSYDGFTTACRTHDYGYDLLRYAEERGEPLGPWARLTIDRQFHRDMIASCIDPGCRVLAHVYGFFVGFNSVRQGFTTPREEPVGPWAMVGAITVAAAPPPSVRPQGFRRPTSVPAPT